jgi:hypothetical protein
MSRNVAGECGKTGRISIWNAVVTGKHEDAAKHLLIAPNTVSSRIVLLLINRTNRSIKEETAQFLLEYLGSRFLNSKQRQKWEKRKMRIGIA